jgi:hypothetical protein
MTRMSRVRIPPRSVRACPVGFSLPRYLDGHNLQLVDAGEVTRVARIYRQLVSHRCRRDHGVISSCCWLPARSPQRRRDASERARGSGIERKWLEVGFGLLKVGLTRCLFLNVAGDERANRQLGQSDRGYYRFLWE